MPYGVFLKKSLRSKPLKLEQYESKTLLEDRIKVKLHFAGINFADVLSRKGLYKWAPSRPYIPGLEGAGEIIEIGSKVDDKNFKLGQKVVVGAQQGCYATEINVPLTNVYSFIPQYSMKENAGFLVTWVTSFLSLYVLGNQFINEESRVLINSAAGGVGSSAVQIAKKMGAYVIGTVGSDEKMDLLYGLGVDEVINYNKTPISSVIRPNSIDFCLESVGGRIFKESNKTIKPLGMLLTIGVSSIDFSIWRPLTWLRAWKTLPRVNVLKMIGKSQSLGGLHIGRLMDIGYKFPWDELVDFVAKNKLKPLIGEIFNLRDANLAHDLIESKKSIGKLLLNCMQENL